VVPSGTTFSLLLIKILYRVHFASSFVLKCGRKLTKNIHKKCGHSTSVSTLKSNITAILFDFATFAFLLEIYLPNHRVVKLYYGKSQFEHNRKTSTTYFILYTTLIICHPLYLPITINNLVYQINIFPAQSKSYLDTKSTFLYSLFQSGIRKLLLLL